MNHRQLKKIWVCNDILMDIFPYFDHAQLGLKLALLSPRFDALVDTHFNGQSELTLWRTIRIHKELAGPKATLSVRIGGNSVAFPWPDRPLPNKIRFRFLRISYIDHAVVEFLRSNQQIFDNGTNLYLILSSCKAESNVQPICDVFVRQIWPIFTTTNVHHLSFKNDAHFDTLLRLTSPSILSNVNINSMHFDALFPDARGDDFDGPNATPPTAGQVLSKWLHTPTANGQPKRLRCVIHPKNLEWITNFKETFLRATTSTASYKVNFGNSTPIELFESVNERTKEKLTLEQVTDHLANFLLKRCPMNGETAADKWENGENLDANLNKLYFVLYDNNWIGPLSPPTEKADQSMETVV